LRSESVLTFQLIVNDGHANSDVSAVNVAVEIRQKFIEGWNLLSFPGELVDNTITGVFGDKILGRLWSFDSEYNTFVIAADLMAATGYWIYAKEDSFSSKLNFISAGSLIESVLELQQGWNLVALKELPMDNSATAIFGNKLSGDVWTWDNQDNLFVVASHMTLFKAYWVYANDDYTGDNAVEVK